MLWVGAWWSPERGTAPGRDRLLQVPAQAQLWPDGVPGRPWWWSTLLLVPLELQWGLHDMCGVLRIEVLSLDR